MYFGRFDCSFCTLAKPFVREFAKKHQIHYFGLDRSADEYNTSLQSDIPFESYHVYDYKRVRSYAEAAGITQIPAMLCNRITLTGDTVTTRLDRLELLSEIDISDNKYPPF